MYGANDYGNTEYGEMGIFSIAYTQTFTDTITIDDPTAVELLLITYIKSFTDTITITGTIFSKAISRILALDTTTPSDTILKSTNSHFSDLITLTETVSHAITRIFSDLFSFVESFIKSKALNENDQIDLSDSYSRTLNLHSTFSEQVDITDTITNLKGKNLTDTIRLSDMIIKYINGLSTAWTKIEKAVSNIWTKQFKP